MNNLNFCRSINLPRMVVHEYFLTILENIEIEKDFSEIFVIFSGRFTTLSVGT